MVIIETGSNDPNWISSKPPEYLMSVLINSLKYMSVEDMLKFIRRLTSEDVARIDKYIEDHSETDVAQEYLDRFVELANKSTVILEICDRLDYLNCWTADGEYEGAECNVDL